MRIHRPKRVNVELLILEAIKEKQQLDALNFQVEELTRARELAADVYNDIRKCGDGDSRRITSASRIYILVCDELQRIVKLRDQQLPVIESLRQRDVPEVNAALDDLCIGGIRFG